MADIFATRRKLMYFLAVAALGASILVSLLSPSCAPIVALVLFVFSIVFFGEAGKDARSRYEKLATVCFMVLALAVKFCLEATVWWN